MRRRALAIAAACGALLVLAWRLRSPETPSLGVDVPAEPRPEPAALAAEPVEVPAQPADPESAELRTTVERPAQAPTELPADADRTTAKAFFAQKYRKFSEEELVAARAVLFEQSSAESSRVKAELVAKGEVETIVVPNGERNPPPIEEATVGATLTFGMLESQRQDDGSSIVKRFRIEASAYPKACALFSEYMWLAAEAAKDRRAR